MKNTFFWVLAFAIIARSDAANSFQLTPQPPLSTNSISTNAQALLGTLKPSMTRAELDKHFGTDGGFYGSVVERHFLDDKATNGMVIMFEVAFRPAGMDDATFVDSKKQSAWFQSHKDWAKREDA